MPIRPLPPLLVNQIAAGEVIERPASVVKELIENAIDAGAARIDITIEDGGRELISIRDDGGGIPAEELVLAVAPHATSKIERAEDLDRIATLGFRGEALASIASVSRLSILSRPREAASGAMLEAEGETIGRLKPCAAPVGTTVTVRNLFFNTPARRKFLRTAVTEGSRIAEMIETIALAHPRIAFIFAHGERMRLELPPEENPRRRAIAVLGAELEDELLEVNLDQPERSGLALWGLIGTPAIARGNANHQRIYLNGRPIRDRSLQHALREAYRGLIEPGRYPTLVLFLEIDPGQVDVNVHPAKAEVRFRNQTMVHGAVLSAVRDRLREADLTPVFDVSRARERIALVPPRDHAPDFGSAVSTGRASESDATARAHHAPTPQDFVDYFRRLDPTQKGFVYSEVKQALAGETPEVARAIEIATESRGAEQSSASSSQDVNGALPEPRRPIEILQVHSSYLVTQDEKGILIIDQHALHERVMFEKLKQRLSGGALESQRLLMPEVVEVDRAAVERLDELRELLSRIGIEADPAGPASIAVHAFPSFLFERGVEVGPFMKELLETHLEGGEVNDIETALHETLDMMACKAAVKAGDRLSPDELRELLAYRETVERMSNCPHGRPTSLRLTIDELNRQFGRT